MGTEPSKAKETDDKILPHHPTYNTWLDRDSIVSICAAVLPDQRVTSIERLDHNKAFNNVIYFINTSSPPDFQETLSQLVLKVPGQIFGPNKIQNEVAGLSLLQKHCPTLPVPRLIAWSEDGRITDKVVRTDSGGSESVLFKLITVDVPEYVISKPTGWLLETRLQGRPINQADLLGPSSTHIIGQMASYISQWRSIPSQDSRIGNFRLRVERNVDAKSTERAAEPVVQGLLSCEQACADDVFASSLSYYDHVIRDALTKLQNNVLFEPSRDTLGSIIRHFASDILPKLPCFSGNESQIVFTHNDLSPRNFLIADGAEEPTVTGIVDFEFSGLFPSETDFATAMVWNAEDWPAETLTILSGESTSRESKMGLDKRGANNFDQGLLLVELIDNIAPWWVHDGMSTGELEGELNKAAAKVRRVISLLERYIR